MVIRAFNNCSKITDYVAWAEKIGRATWRARRGGSWCSASRRRCKAQTRPVAMKHKRFVKSCFCIILSQWLLVHRRSYWRRQHITQQLPTGLLCRPTLLFQKKAAERVRSRLPHALSILLFTGGRGRATLVVALINSGLPQQFTLRPHHLNGIRPPLFRALHNEKIRSGLSADNEVSCSCSGPAGCVAPAPLR